LQWGLELMLGRWLFNIACACGRKFMPGLDVPVQEEGSVQHNGRRSQCRGYIVRDSYEGSERCWWGPQGAAYHQWMPMPEALFGRVWFLLPGSCLECCCVCVLCAVLCGVGPWSHVFLCLSHVLDAGCVTASTNGNIYCLVMHGATLQLLCSFSAVAHSVFLPSCVLEDCLVSRRCWLLVPLLLALSM
jgi:hypothetical protein